MLALSLPLVLGATVKLVTNVRDLSAGQVGCPYAQRCWLALELKGVPYERVEIDLRAKPQWLLRVSPLGRVPALITDDEHAVVESTVINEFLEEAFPAAPALLPSGLWERASQRVLVHRVDSRFIPAGFRYLCYGGDKYEDAWRAELAFWDAALCSAPDGGPFLGGERMGLADVALAPFVERLDAALAVHRRHGVRATCTEAGLGALARWCERVWSLEAFERTRCESEEAIARVYEPVAVRGMSYLNQ